MVAMPRSGKMTIGNRAVAAIGTASVAHQTAMRTPTDAVIQPASDRPVGAPDKAIVTASTGPRNRPTTWCVDLPSCCKSVNG